METLSCYSNQSTSATAIKNIIFVEANVTLLIVLQSFSFIPVMASEEIIFEYFFGNLAFRLPWQPIQFRGLDKDNTFDRGLLKEHFCKTLVKIFAK